MKTLQEFVIEKLKIQKQSAKKTTVVANGDELHDLIHTRYEESANKEHIDCTDIDVSKVVDFKEAFSGLNNLKTIDITGWDTSNARKFKHMFSFSYSLQEIIGLNELDTSNVDDMSSMFANCSTIKSIDISNWNTDSLENTTYMFMGCTKLEELKGVENMNMSKVSNILQMFSGCKKLKSLDLSGWDASNISNVFELFGRCVSLEEVSIAGWKSKITSTFKMFNECTSLKKVDLTGLEKKKLIKIDKMFYNCKNLETIIGGIEDWDMDNLKYAEDAFTNCEKLKVDLSKWKVSNVPNISKAFKNADNIIKPEGV